MYAVQEIHTGQEPCAVLEVQAVRKSYAEQAVAHRWQTLVRERAVERWGPAGPRHITTASLEREADPLLTPDPDPDDEIYRLGERCAEAYIEADALHYQAMVLLAEFHRRRGWQDTGFSSTAEWLAWRIGIQAGFTKARALTRVATPENETTLLDLARAGSAANLERVLRGWKTLDRT